MKTITIIAIISVIVLSGIVSGIIFLENNYHNDEVVIGQNDLACFTVWKVQLNSNVDYNILEKILRDKIAELSSSYDLSQREISIENIGNNRVKITVAGAWWIGPNYTSPDLRKSISSIEYVEQIEDFIGGPNEGGCY